MPHLNYYLKSKPVSCIAKSKCYGVKRLSKVSLLIQLASQRFVLRHSVRVLPPLSAFYQSVKDIQVLS